MRDADVGLTLIEMLVVLAIVGIGSGAALLSLSPARGIGVETEARRLARAIQSAADATMVGGAAPALIADADGYRVATWTGTAWQGGRHDLPAGMAIEGAGSRPVAVALGNGTAVDLHLARGDDAWAVSFDGVRATAVRADPRR